MSDLIFVLLSLAFFAAAWFYIVALKSI